MPELPEVETIRRGLEKRLINRRIRNISVLEAKSWQVASENLKFIKDCKITYLSRRAKMLIIGLSSDYALLVHLRMTGQLIFREPQHHENDFAAGHPTASFTKEMPDRSTRIIFDFDDESRLFFNDQRKFGYMKLVKKSEIEKETFIAELGPEIVDFTQTPIPDKISPEVKREFIRRVRHHQKTVIKAAILDQKVISGIGNIYADEGLWGAKIHPETRVTDLTDYKLRQLLDEVRKVMTRSIESGGSTMQTYVRADGSKGNYLELFANVFRREGQACPRCRHEIIKLRVAGRGSHICPNCQKIVKKKEI